MRGSTISDVFFAAQYLHRELLKRGGVEECRGSADVKSVVRDFGGRQSSGMFLYDASDVTFVHFSFWCLVGINHTLVPRLTGIKSRCHIQCIIKMDYVFKLKRCLHHIHCSAKRYRSH